MKIVLVQPPVQDFYDTDIRLQPIGLCYLKAAIKKYMPEMDVLVRDYHSGSGRKTVALPKELSYLTEYYPVADRSPFSAFYQYYHFGQSFDNIEAELAEMRPDVVGISSLFTPYYREALEVAVRVKKRLDVPVIMGGSHVSEAPDSVLAHSCVDHVVRGEGERPIVEYIEYLTGKRKVEDVSGLGYKNGGKFHYNPVKENYSVELLPFPDLRDLSPSHYEFAGKPLSFMITSRGCPHRCSFCSVHSTFGNRYRRRPVDNIIKEIEHRYRDGCRVIDFEDDNISFHKEEFRQLCLSLIGLFPQRQMEFAAMNGISYMSLDNELLELMLRAGFSRLNLSLVSIDRGVRDMTERPHTPDTYVEVVNKAFQLGFKIVSYQILGLPYESLQSMVGTLVFHARLPVLLGASPFYRTPNAPIARGLELTEEDFIRARLTAMAPETPSYKREDIYTLFITTRIINFLKGLDIHEDVNIRDILHQKWQDKHVSSGIKLLELLMKTGKLYFQTTKGLVENKKFRAELFFHVLGETGTVACLNGRRIKVN
jgi:radical SAM superfamily enzyme YgiQ (UPF0313 family)